MMAINNDKIYDILSVAIDNFRHVKTNSKRSLAEFMKINNDCLFVYQNLESATNLWRFA